jgi:signal transduction histidine kinase
MTVVDHGAGPAFPTGATLARVIAVARWLNWVWIAAIVIVADLRTVTVESVRLDDPSGPSTALRQPVVAWSCVAVVLAMCIWGTVLVRRAPRNALRGPFVAAEGLIALALSVLDGWVFDPGHVFETSQSLAAQYPLIAAATVGLAVGPWWGAAFGGLVGPAEWWAVVLNRFDDFSLRHAFSLVATSLFFGAAGAVFGWLGRLLRNVESTIADQRARNEVANVLHDTVLQTLAVVEQRSAQSDPELAASARRADRELRNYLFGASAHGTEDLEGRVRHAVERATRDHDVDVTVNVVDLGSSATVKAQEALAGAIGEAVTNAIKHASSSRIVVFVETADDGEVSASVRDDGVGFDVEAAVNGRHGLDGSIRRRIEAVGGRTEVVSRPGVGTDVRLWVR